ncbi:MAG: glycosyltransferase family 2 protein [Planctomycetota bacterium]|nr:glycosyltransferase family 2 protein [Planctomycetota bacterium]
MAPQAPDLSILIVNWNGKQMLRDLLGSIRRTQENLTVQTIVTDNASTDGSVELVATEFPEVQLICNPANAGFGRGNNQAAGIAHAPLLLLLNNDTIVRANALQRLIAFITQHPEVVAVGPQLIGGDGKPQRSGRQLPTFAALLNSIQFMKWTAAFRRAYQNYRRGGFDPATPGSIGQLAAAALLIRRDIFEKCHGFDEGFEFGVEDVDLCARLKDFGAIYYFPEAQIDHLGRVSSRANRGFVYRGYECGWARYLRKHHGPTEAIIYKFLVTLDMPFRLIILVVQLCFQRISNQHEKAQRTSALLKAAAEFTFTALPLFWRA